MLDFLTLMCFELCFHRLYVLCLPITAAGVPHLPFGIWKSVQRRLCLRCILECSVYRTQPESPPPPAFRGVFNHACTLHSYRINTVKQTEKGTRPKLDVKHILRIRVYVEYILSLSIYFWLFTRADIMVFCVCQYPAGVL